MNDVGVSDVDMSDKVADGVVDRSREMDRSKEGDEGSMVDGVAASRTYAIGAVAKLTGLTVHNLRVWEKRHQAFEVSRTETGRRLYTQENLDRIMLLKQCVDKGHSIGMIAKTSDEELERFIERFEAQAERLATSAESDTDSALVLSNEHLDVGGLPFVVESTVSSFTQFKADIEHSHANIWWLEFDTLDECLGNQVLSLVRCHQPDMVVLLYRFAPSHLVELLQIEGLLMFCSTVEYAVLGEAISRHLRERSVTDLFKPGGVYPKKRFNKTQLAKIVEMKPPIECECPRHLVGLIRQLSAFERYMVDCRHRNQEDADLHHALQFATAEARVIVEKSLQYLLSKEQVVVI